MHVHKHYLIVRLLCLRKLYSILLVCIQFKSRLMISLVIDSIEDDELIVPEELEEWDPVPDVTAVASSGQSEDACPVGGGGVRFDGQVKGDFVLRAPVFQ